MTKVPPTKKMPRRRYPQPASALPLAMAKTLELEAFLLRTAAVKLREAYAILRSIQPRRYGQCSICFEFADHCECVDGPHGTSRQKKCAR